MSYKIYTERNNAETSRDPDDYTYKQIGQRDTLPEAVRVAQEYIENHFIKKSAELRAGKGKQLFRATDFCSWPETIIIEKL